MTTTLSSLADVQAGVDYLAPHSLVSPEVLLILGSGLGHVADSITDAQSFPTHDIPGYPISTAPGHKGRLIFGALEGRNVMVVQGRIHVYEGYTPHEAAFPVRLAKALGASKFIVTNAAGGINPSFSPGTLMLITNHINMVLDNPLEARTLIDPHATPIDSPYDSAWIAAVLGATQQSGIDLQQGVYLWTHGPAYETKAEIRAFSRLGADAVGMSTVPEVNQAHALGMQTLGVSTITNHATGLSPDLLKHEDVLEVGRQLKSTLEHLLRIILQKT